MFSISFRKYRDEEKEKQLVYFDHQNVTSLCLRYHYVLTARASSVFLWSYRNTVLNQSTCVLALGYFLKCDNEQLTYIWSLKSEVQFSITNTNDNSCVFLRVICDTRFKLQVSVESQ